MLSLHSSPALSATVGGPFSGFPGAGESRVPDRMPMRANSPAVTLQAHYGLPVQTDADAAVAGYRFPSADPSLPPTQLMALPCADAGAEGAAQMLRFLSSLHQEGRTDLALVTGHSQQAPRGLDPRLLAGEIRQFDAGGLRGTAWVEQHEGEDCLVFDLQSSQGLSVTHMVRLHQIDLTDSRNRTMERLSHIDSAVSQHQLDAKAEAENDRSGAASMGTARPLGGLALACADGASESGAALILLDAHQRHLQLVNMAIGQTSATLEQAQQMADRALDRHSYEQQRQAIMLQGQEWLGKGFASGSYEAVSAGLDLFRTLAAQRFAPWIPDASGASDAPAQHRIDSHVGRSTSSGPGDGGGAVQSRRRDVPAPPIPPRRSFQADGLPTSAVLTASPTGHAPAPTGHAPESSQGPAVSAAPTSQTTQGSQASAASGVATRRGLPPPPPPPGTAARPVPARPAPIAPPSARPAATPSAATPSAEDPASVAKGPQAAGGAGTSPLSAPAQRAQRQDAAQRQHQHQAPADAPQRKKRPAPQPPNTPPHTPPHTPPASASHPPAAAKQSQAPEPGPGPRSSAAGPASAKTPPSASPSKPTGSGSPTSPTKPTRPADSDHAATPARRKAYPAPLPPKAAPPSPQKQPLPPDPAGIPSVPTLAELGVTPLSSERLKAQEAELEAINKLAEELLGPDGPVKGDAGMPLTSFEERALNPLRDKTAAGTARLDAQSAPAYDADDLPREVPPRYSDLLQEAVLLQPETLSVAQIMSNFRIKQDSPEVASKLMQSGMDQLVGLLAEPPASPVQRFKRLFSGDALRAQKSHQTDIQNDVLTKLWSSIKVLDEHFVASDPALSAKDYKEERGAYIESHMASALLNSLSRASPEAQARALKRMANERDDLLSTLQESVTHRRGLTRSSQAVAEFLRGTSEVPATLLRVVKRVEEAARRRATA